MSSLIWVLDLVSLGLRGLLVAIMVRRGQQRLFFFFFVYLAFSILSTLARLVVRNRYVTFFYVFWATEAVYAILSALVILEVFRHVFIDFYESTAFRVFLAFAVVLIAILTLGAPIRHHVEVSSVTALVLSANLAVRFIQVAALALFLGLAVFFNMRGWRYEIGIVLGYGLFAAVYLVALALRSQLGANYGWTVTVAHPLAYDCAVVIWLWAFWKNQPRPTLQEYLGKSGPEGISNLLGRTTTAYKRFGEKRWTR
jgi:hypothetical protein